MNRWSKWFGVALAGLVGCTTSLQVQAGDEQADVVNEWNDIVEQVVPAGGLSPPRQYAMVHIAMFDAMNSVERAYQPYRFRVGARGGASADLAAAQAAHDVLAAQFPDRMALFDAALQRRIASARHGQVRGSVHIGKAIAAAVLAWRMDDGWSVPPVAFTQPAFPGLYQPTPPALAPAAFRQLATTRPFALVTATQYLPGAPPSLTSERYARDLEETKTLGAVASIVRTAEQTQLAQLFASITSRTVHWALWNHVARDVAHERGLSSIETARLLAFLNATIHDAVQSSHTSKFVYGVWRPVTAIRRADEDMNPLTTADPEWLPLLTTPPYPSHAGNMACVGAGAARVLQLVFGGDDVVFTARWQGAPGHPDVTREYASFWQLAQDQANSRIYGGIHFRYESEVSQAACPKVAEYVFANYMRERK